MTTNWWLPAGLIAALLGGLGFAAFKRRQNAQIDDFASMAATDVDADLHEQPGRLLGARKATDDSFVVEESGEHKAPEIIPPRDLVDIPSADDTMSSETAVNLDQGDPLAEADFHMAYGLYDQAADLVRIALEREPDRRDLRLKLLEIYFVWGNKDLFLQTAKTLEATRDRAPAGEWDKIVIMGKQICPDEPMFANAVGSGRGAGALVDLNLEGGENHVDIDLFGEPGTEPSHHDIPAAKVAEDAAATSESAHLHDPASIDFLLDEPGRGADESPTREMPPRDEPTVESEIMQFGDSPTAESPALTADKVQDLLTAKLPQTGTDQTAEVSIDDLGLDLDALDETGAPALSGSHLEKTGHPLEETDHPADAPTMVAGLDEHSRKLLADAESRARDRDLTELERELEASFISELESSHEEIKTAVIPPDSAPTVQMPREIDVGATSRFRQPSVAELEASQRVDPDSTSKLRSISSDSIDLDLDHLAGALAGGDTVDQPRAAEDLFSSEVFEASQRSRRVDLDVGEAMNGADGSTTRTLAQNGTARLQPNGGEVVQEFEPVTMSEVGTKLDLARAYMDMGDPEGARNILDEVLPGRLGHPEAGSPAADRFAPGLTRRRRATNHDAASPSVVEYDGAAFSGWQQQVGLRPSIQDEVQRALAFVAGHPDRRSICAGRTDAGVHAVGQVVHFDTDAAQRRRAPGCSAPTPAAAVDRPALGARSRRRTSMRAIRRPARTYRYCILNRSARSALRTHRAAWIHRPLDVEPMHGAAQSLIGEHDFSAFRADRVPGEIAGARASSRATVRRDGDFVCVRGHGERLPASHGAQHRRPADRGPARREPAAAMAPDAGQPRPPGRRPPRRRPACISGGSHYPAVFGLPDDSDRRLSLPAARRIWCNMRHVLV